MAPSKKTKEARFQFHSRGARLDVLPLDAGFILTVGPASLWLDHETAEETVLLLADAIDARYGLAGARRSSN
jgi:hypothetical protein